LEQEGTYPLPEAQLDRFLLKLTVPFVSRDELHEILERTTGTTTSPIMPVMTADEILRHRDTVRAVVVSRPVRDYAVRLVLATHPQTAESISEVRQHVRAGASPRGAQALLLAAKVRALRAGRYHASFEDIREAVEPALRHRVLLNFEAIADGIRIDQLLQTLVRQVPEIAPGSSS
jgi:MoxR-like ATPase